MVATHKYIISIVSCSYYTSVNFSRHLHVVNTILTLLWSCYSFVHYDTHVWLFALFSIEYWSQHSCEAIHLRH